MTQTPLEPQDTSEAPVGAAQSPSTPGWAAALAGAVGAAVALAIGELAAGLFRGVPSLTTAVGQQFIPLTPEWLKDIAISLFGTADKPIFVGGVVVVSVLLGAVVGYRARRDRFPALLVFLGLGVFGVLAASTQSGASTGQVVVTTAIAIAAGLGSLLWLVAAAGAERRVSDAPTTVVDGGDRRRFLLGSTALASLAGISAVIGNVLRLDRVTSTVSSTDVALPPGGESAPPVGPANQLQVDGITPVVVPNDEFYRIDTALGTPLVDAATWNLTVLGMVDTPLQLNYEDLLARDVVERYVTLSCVSNEVGDDLVGNALWRGVLLAPLLEEAGIDPGAGQIVGRSVDGWTAGFPVEAAFDRDAMIAFGMNGDPLPAAHGFPARLVVPGLYGYVSATTWLTEIELTTWGGFDGYWIPRGWAKEGPIKTQSRIDVPADGTQIEAGPTVVAGVAWAGTRDVARVEIRRTGATDGEWVEAEITEPLGDATWVQWRAEIDLPEGPSQLQVRATDAEGMTQSSDRVPPRPDGAEGWHTIRVFT